MFIYRYNFYLDCMQMDGMTKLDEKQIDTIIRLIQMNQKFNTKYKYKNIMHVRRKFF